MTTAQSGETMRAFQTLRNLARKPERQVEHCELCHGELCDDHPHLIELANRRIVCSCEACAMLFTGRETAKYRRIPRQIRRFVNFRLTDSEWDGLKIGRASCRERV